jgi:hypothetical protein
MQKVYLLRLMPCSLRWLIMLAAYFCISCKSQVEYNCSLIKVDWLDACIVLGVVGAVLDVFLCRWCKICTILQPLGSKGRYLKKSTKPCWPLRSKETWIKYSPLILLSQPKLAITGRKDFLRYKIIGAHKNGKIHAWPQKPNPSLRQSL